MTIPCHLLISWHVARQVTPDVKARRWIAWAGVIPDLDGAGLLIDAATHRTNFYEKWHHLAGHNFLAGLVVAALAATFCRRITVGLWAALSFNLHMVADLISGRGPDGSAWPILYGWPFSRHEWQWSGQWRLDAWPNTVVFLLLVGWMLVAVRRSGRSPLELFATRLDVQVLTAFRSVCVSRRAGGG